MHTQTMVTKTISVTDEAYMALLREKKGEESFTETILRITAKAGKLADCFGVWRMTDEEETSVQGELDEGWRATEGRLHREVP
jgi:predicted CopG family antitoxin